jgi:hypothetical protein
MTDINYNSLYDYLKILDNNIIKSDTTDSEDSNVESDNENNIERNNISLNFEDFKKVSSIDQNKYIKQKIEDRGIDPNQYLTDWFISAATKNTNGSKVEIENFVNKNLDIIIKNERESQLNTHAFKRVKPFLKHITDKNPNDLPNIIPMNNIMSEYERQEIIDAINKEKDNMLQNNKNIEESKPTNESSNKN